MNPKNTTHLSDRHLAEKFVSKWIDFRFGVFDFDASTALDGGIANERGKYSELVVNLINDTIDGVRVESDQLQLSTQDKLCDGKTYEKVIGQHPDITQGRISINDQHSLQKLNSY